MSDPGPPPPGAPPRSFLDTRAARLVAFVVMLAALAGLGYYHRDDLFPPEKEAPPEDAAYLRCLEKQYAGIERMVKEGVVAEERADLFRQRAEALCRYGG
ncbi:MAG: hypothetical protein GWN84_07340, partial [Gammaproteobacteria bacterium]|nr:hypothetical protein [Gammaproteobacteria bacterium]